MRLTCFLIMITSVFMSCQKREKKIPSDFGDYFNIKAKGTVKKGIYVFCGVVAKEIEYEYRVGKWIFEDNNVKIAEGEYEVVINKEENLGGCEYSYYLSTINLDKWKFWNKRGELIEPTEKHIDLIKSKELKHRVNF
ncbi:conserved hypothetical protein [Tenacibaculum sp. 190524A05c]|uniref:DUF4377 domain-containing protein n=2 Tax=Tenacibaculum platacis TaxID=3137852 RepID=A0ABM9P4L6_9FLAO